MNITFATPSLSMDHHRCHDCGRWWALEAGWSGDCPKCARDITDERIARIEELERSNRALRGALTARKVARQ